MKKHLTHFAIVVVFCCACFAIYTFACSPATARVKDRHFDILNMWDGFFYTGTLVDGLFSGDGTIDFDNGDSYCGTFLSGRYNGRGTFISYDGWQYEGDFIDGEMVGGFVIVIDGYGSLSGTSIGDKLSVSADGWQYDGDVYESGLSGAGTFSSGGVTYVGQFSHGLAHGEGKYTDLDRHIAYFGGFYMGMFQGRGQLHDLEVGWTYDGQFANGLFDGDGTIIESNGTKHVGTWDKGELINVK